jgi:hypothetical protein
LCLGNSDDSSLAYGRDAAGLAKIDTPAATVVPALLASLVAIVRLTEPKTLTCDVSPSEAPPETSVRVGRTQFMAVFDHA